MLDRPFAPQILKHARALAEQFQVILQAEDDPKFVGHSLELPGAVGGGDTPDEAVAQIRDAVTTAIAVMLEAGETPPRPAREAKRTEQINLRVSAEEKTRIEAAARREGFRGVSDYVRTRALSER